MDSQGSSHTRIQRTPAPFWFLSPCRTTACWALDRRAPSFPRPCSSPSGGGRAVSFASPAGSRSRQHCGPGCPQVHMMRCMVPVCSHTCTSAGVGRTVPLGHTCKSVGVGSTVPLGHTCTSVGVGSTVPLHVATVSGQAAFLLKSVPLRSAHRVMALLPRLSIAAFPPRPSLGAPRGIRHTRNPRRRAGLGCALVLGLGR